MAVRAGQILVDAAGFVIDRIQTGGVNNLNIPMEKIHEVGNFLTTGIVRDIPDLSFDMQSLDVSTDIEALVCGTTPPAVVAGVGATPTPTMLDFATNTIPIDVTSPFRAAQGQYNIVQGVVVPFLNLEQVSYRFGVRANAQETFTLRGDSIYYIPGVPIKETKPGGATSYTFNFAPAIPYTELGQTIYALSVWWNDPTTGLIRRLFKGQDYADTTTGFTLNAGVTIPNTATVRYCYGTAPITQATPTVPFYYGPNATSSAVVKPAAIRSKDFDVYIGNPPMTRLTGVQSFDATFKVALQQDQEFGNAHYVNIDFNFSDVSGTIGLRNRDPYDVIAKIQTIAGVATTQIAGPLTSPPLPLEVRLRNPTTSALIKTLYIPDATFTNTPIQGRQNNKLDTSFRFDSNSGDLQVFKGARIAGEA